MANMALDGPIGDRIRIYRGRRGLSQRELAGLIGRSESWLSQVERGVRTVDRFSVLVDIAQVLKTNVQTLAGTRMEFAPNGDEHVDGIDAVMTALTVYPSLARRGERTEVELDLDDIDRQCAEAHARYQSADYVAAARVITRLLGTVDTAVRDARPDALRRALTLQHSAYIVTAKLLTKVGDAHFAWLSADRAVNAAARLDAPDLAALAAYQVTCALLELDRIDEAERIALTAAESLDDDTPFGISAQGALPHRRSHRCSPQRPQDRHRTSTASPIPRQRTW